MRFLWKIALALGLLCSPALAQQGPDSLPGCVYNATPPTLTDKQASVWQCDINGKLITSGGGAGTVTSVSVTTANGISGTVANPTTTPAISLTLGAITPSSVALGGCTIGSQVFCETGAASLNGVETIQSGGNIGFGTETNPQSSFVFSKNVTSGPTSIAAGQAGVVGQGADSTAFGYFAFTFGAAPQNIFLRADGTATSPTAAVATDQLGVLGFGGYSGSGTTYLNGARIQGVATETFSTNRGTFIELDATPTGSATRAQAMRLQAGVIVGTGTSDPGAGNVQLSSGGGHYLATGTAPSISSCGTGSPTTSGSDAFGTVAAGGGVLSSCVINFGTTWGAAPRCVVSSGTAISSLTVTTSQTQLTIGGTSLTGDTINWICGSTASLEPRDLPAANDNWPPWLSKAA